MCVYNSPIVRGRTYIHKVTLEVLVLSGCLNGTSPLDPVPVFAVARAIHLVLCLAYRDTFFIDVCSRQVLDVSFIGGVKRDEWTHVPQVTGYPVEAVSVMGSVEATVVNMVSHAFDCSIHGKHTWHGVMSAASDHHEIGREFILVVWTPAVNLIEIVAKDVAISVCIVTPGGIW